MANWICREDVLKILSGYAGTGHPLAVAALELVAALPSFPDPNPDWKHNDRNVMGQTEEEFWEKVDK